jgi:hypothetical protein
MTPDVWFSDGLRFECTQCGDCCTGAPGHVWVNQDEIAAMAETLGIPAAEFEEVHVRNVGVRKSLREHENGDCVLFDATSRRCTVYATRPRQCRTWPFWESNIKSPDTWRDTCQACPGCGKGEVVSVEEVIRQSKVIRL